jgi:hypothetical protein
MRAGREFTCSPFLREKNKTTPIPLLEQTHTHLQPTTKYMSTPNPEHEKLLRRAIEMSRRALPW